MKHEITVTVSVADWRREGESDAWSILQDVSINDVLTFDAQDDDIDESIFSLCDTTFTRTNDYDHLRCLEELSRYNPDDDGLYSPKSSWSERLQAEAFYTYRGYVQSCVQEDLEYLEQTHAEWSDVEALEPFADDVVSTMIMLNNNTCDGFDFEPILNELRNPTQDDFIAFRVFLDYCREHPEIGIAKQLLATFCNDDGSLKLPLNW